MSDCDKHDDENSRPYAHDCFECAVRDEMLSADLSFAAAYDEAIDRDSVSDLHMPHRILAKRSVERVMIALGDTAIDKAVDVVADRSGGFLLVVSGASARPRAFGSFAELDYFFKRSRRTAAERIITERRAT